jgi:tripartite-type tricarboxylate transporter receptor subunit TctC
MLRDFRIIGFSFIISPEVPKQRVEVLKEAFQNIFKDPKLAKTFRKLTGADASTLTPEEQKKTIRNILRDPVIIALFKKIASAGPLPSRLSRGRT